MFRLSGIAFVLSLTIGFAIARAPVSASGLRVRRRRRAILTRPVMSRRMICPTASSRLRPRMGTLSSVPRTRPLRK
jgi:hypothetical protein